MAQAQRKTAYSDGAHRAKNNVYPINMARKKSAESAKKSGTKKRKNKIKTKSLVNRIRREISYGKGFDKRLFAVVTIMVIFGLIMVFSASAPSASAYKGTPYYYFIRQLIFAVIGFIAMIVVSFIDYHKLGGKVAIGLLIAGFLLLLAVYTPLGMVVNNSRRWINLGFTTLQPSEIVKFALILYFAYSLSVIKDKIKLFKNGLLRYLIILAVFVGVLFLEPHLSASIVILATCGIMLVFAGAKFRHFIIPALMAIPAGVIYILKNPYQISRIVNIDPFTDASDSGFQVANSLYAIGSGGIFGLGLGQSRQKFLYLPEPQNDFIFAIIGEELGLIGAIAVILLFAYLVWRGYKIASAAPDKFGMLLAGGITTLIAIQMVLNIAVATASIPATGVALPFFSYGGTSLCILMTAMGVLLNISRQTLNVKKKPDVKEENTEK